VYLSHNALQLSAGAFGKNCRPLLESDGSKGHVFEISIGVGTIYNFDIRGSAGILLVLDGRNNSCTGDKGSGLVLVF
jgi:hypothetical protein